MKNCEIDEKNVEFMKNCDTDEIIKIFSKCYRRPLFSYSNSEF
jgi:hypothetical protein